MRISDCSSDVCSSDLAARDAHDWDLERRDDWLLLRKPLSGHGRAAIAHALIELVELPAMAPLQRALGRLLGRQDRKRVVWGQSVYVRVDHGGRRITKQ